MFDRETTEAKTLRELYEFGAKCYKKGYRKAVVDILAGFSIAAMMMVSVSKILHD